MPIKVDGIRWNNDPESHYDIHVLRGQKSRDLRVGLTIHDQDADIWRSLVMLPAGSGISVKFKPHFDGVPNASGIQHKHGVRFDTSSGIIEPDGSAPPPPVLRNFIIEAEVTHSGAVITSPSTAYIRAHVHDGLRRIWLTPKRYEGHLNATGARLSVLAEFTDDTVGDVSDWLLKWSTIPAGHANISVDAFSGVLKFTGARVFPDSAVKVKVETRSPLPPGSAEAEVYSTERWTTARNIEHIQGPGAPSTHPNILCVSEGFHFTERTEFEALVKRLISAVTTKNGPTRPYDLVGKNINWWLAWVPSNTRGVSVLSEVAGIRSPSSTTRRAKPIETPRVPDTASNDWDVEDLLFEGGLPVPIDDPANRSLSSKQTDWTALYSSAISTPRAKRYKEWLALRDRTLVDEIDTAFGFGVGSRPNAERTISTLLGPNLKRLSGVDLDGFLINLKFPGKAGVPAEPTIGHTWSTGRSGAVPAGKDAGLVCFFARTNRTAGTNAPGRYFATGMGMEDEHLLKATGRKELEVEPAKIPTTVSIGPISILGHELAHGIALDDEYGGGHQFPDGNIPRSRDRGNIQPHKELLPAPAGLSIDTAKIKWNWPRIREAAVITADVKRLNPNVLPAELELRLPPFAAASFARDAIVRLRSRPLLPSHVLSDRLIVAADPQSTTAGDTVRVNQIIAAPFDETKFLKDSIVFLPVMDAGNELTLIHPDVLAHLGAHGRPLNATQPPAAWACAPSDGRQNATNLPASLAKGVRKRPVYSAFITGLYDGGDEFHCGIYHPSGVCLMRDGYPIAGTQTIYSFCPVCRYVMVDILDPSFHGTIEADYEKTKYPK